jgi:hypothetical protein
MNKTIIYYSSNREDERFEQKIIDNLKKQAGDIPIISVTQKPVDLGENIYVGDVGFSYLNEWRQILIGAKKATTEYIIFAESDFLYPPDYFKLEPKEDLYRYDNIWIVFPIKYGDTYKQKKESEGAQICRRDLLIEKYEEHLKGQPEWWNWPITIVKDGNNPLTGVPITYFTGDPCLSFKTGKGLKGVTNVNHNRKKTLPYWGDISIIRKNYEYVNENES